MKIYLDLLPEEKKKEIRKRKLFLKIIREEILFSVPIFAFFAILATINFSLAIKSQATENSFNSGNSQKEYQELKSYEKKFSDINSKLPNIYKIQKSHLNWLGVFYKISDVTPKNVYISDLTTSDYKISLAGKAKTREDFLAFQANVKSNDCFSDVNVPLSSLVSKENVEFQIDFSVKVDCLKNKK
jgi:Tfp pilus assembly protein PilN